MNFLEDQSSVSLTGRYDPGVDGQADSFHIGEN